MAKIALIDTWVDPDRLQYGLVHHISFLPETHHRSGVVNHGTMCAMIIDHCTRDYELFNLEVLPDTGKGKSFGLVEQYIKALEKCIELGVDIVSVSSVSSYLYDTNSMYDIAKRLSETTAIVAALDNQRYITVPTSYPFVTGVQCDLKNHLKPGELAFYREDPFGAEVYANCSFSILSEQFYSPSNSFAVPVVAAYLHEMMRQTGMTAKDAQQMLQQLPFYPNVQPLRNTVTNRPTVLIRGNISLTLPLCRQMLDEFYMRYEVLATALILNGVSSDIRIRSVQRIENLQAEIRFMENHYKTDLVFLLSNLGDMKTTQHTIEVDAVLDVKSEKEFGLHWKNDIIRTTLENVTHILYDALSEDDPNNNINLYD